MFFSTYLYLLGACDKKVAQTFNVIALAITLLKASFYSRRVGYIYNDIELFKGTSFKIKNMFNMLNLLCQQY